MIECPTSWRGKFKGYTEKQLKKKKCTLRLERLKKTSEGCHLREYVKQDVKKITFTRFKIKNEKKTKTFDSADAMDRSIFEEDCLKPVEYANNNEGSLFPPTFKECNVDKLNTLLQHMTYAYGEFTEQKGFSRNKVAGISSSMLYFGTYASTFPWHTEDADLPSVNYMHQGAAKIWFSIPASK